jgi:hypothetical protein
MGLGSERDLVPLGAGFDIVKRGYSRAQVEEHLERLDSDLRLIAADRDAAVSQAADLARQMERARSQIDELRAQVDRLSLPPTTLEGLSERLQRMLKLAQEEASDTKARAEADAVQLRARAEADATALRNRYEKLIAEVDGRRIELETEHREVMAKAHADLAAKAKEAEAARITADEAAKARRTQIEEDFEIAMAARRTESMKALAEQEATSKAEAERRLREATEEAARIRAQVAEEQRTSKAEAERRVREATEEANRRRHEAITEAQARLQDAVDEAHRRVREATEEANRRMSHASGRVEALRSLRTQIAEQLRSAHTLITNATPALDPLPEEQEPQVPATPPAQQAGPVAAEWPSNDPAPVPASTTPTNAAGTGTDDASNSRGQSTTAQEIANAPTRRNNSAVAPPKGVQPAKSGQSGQSGQQGPTGAANRPAAQPNRQGQTARREPSGKR